MSEMIERVARAIYGDSFPEWKDIDAAPRTKAIFVDMALAAIDAMRDPTEDMIIVGDENILETLNDHTFALSFKTPSFKCWQGMIDAALKEQTK